MTVGAKARWLERSGALLGFEPHTTGARSISATRDISEKYVQGETMFGGMYPTASLRALEEDRR